MSDSDTDMNKPKGQKAKAQLIKVATSLFAETGKPAYWMI